MANEFGPFPSAIPPVNPYAPGVPSYDTSSILARMGLLVPKSDPTKRPIPTSALKPKAQPASGYTPENVLKSQGDVANWYQTRPLAPMMGGPTGAMIAGGIANVGNGFMSTYLPRQAEEKMLANQRLSAEAMRAALAAKTPQERQAALAGSGDPTQAAIALRESDPHEIARTKIAEQDMEIKKTQAAAAARKEAFEQSLFGDNPTPAPAAAPSAVAPTMPVDAGGVPPQAAPPPQAPAGAAPMPVPAQQTGASPVAPQAAAPALAPQPVNTATMRQVLEAMPPAERTAMGVLYRTKPEEFAKVMFEKINPAAATSRTVSEAAARERGKGLGEAQVGLPAALQAASSITNNIDAVIDDPHLGYMTGWQSAGPLKYLPNTPWGNDTEAKIKQLQGQNFMQAFSSLKGGGQITEKEGEKATAAIARLENMGQSDAGYLQALHDARKEIHDLSNLARVRAGQAPVAYVPKGEQKPSKEETKVIGGQTYVKRNGEWHTLGGGVE